VDTGLRETDNLRWQIGRKFLHTFATDIHFLATKPLLHSEEPLLSLSRFALPILPFTFAPD
jgi:hypothetical protein